VQSYLREDEEQEKGRNDDSDQGDPSAISTPCAIISVAVAITVAVYSDTVSVTPVDVDGTFDKNREGKRKMLSKANCDCSGESGRRRI